MKRFFLAALAAVAMLCVPSVLAQQVLVKGTIPNYAGAHVSAVSPSNSSHFTDATIGSNGAFTVRVWPNESYMLFVGAVGSHGTFFIDVPPSIDSPVDVSAGLLAAAQAVGSGGSGNSHWAGKGLYIFGDSYLQFFSTGWVPPINTALGTTLIGTDGVSGRPMANIFSNYSAQAGSGGSQINILDTSAMTASNIVSSTNGTLLSPYAGYSATDYMDVRGAPTVIANFQFGMYTTAGAGYAWYAADKTFLSGVLNPQQNGGDFNTLPGTVITVPTGAKYLRVWWSNNITNGTVGVGGAMVVTGNTIPGSYVAYSPSAQYSANGGSGILVDGAGHTLAQNLAGVSLCIVELSTNNGTTTIGAPGDSITAATFYGQTLYAAQMLHAANPGMRVLWVTTVQINAAAYNGGTGGGAGPVQAANLVTAMKYVAGLYGDRVADMLHNSGINQYNWNLYLRDGVHLTDAYSTSTYAPIIINEANLVY